MTLEQKLRDMKIDGRGLSLNPADVVEVLVWKDRCDRLLKLTESRVESVRLAAKAAFYGPDR